MPLGWERINNKRSTPNKNIVFIKPLPSSTEATAKDFLERIAAQCVPIMNNHHIAVVSLEEYEPNLEFWGRNFNNGEVIQLVLRSPSTGRWLPFKFVQMVMMHELAHNKQMNHSAVFWKVRNEFSNEMKELWSRGYTGEGLWGRGVLLENGAFAQEELGEGEILPEHMCGGTFKSRGGRKRKAKPKISYKEQQERRIKKKFGTNGMTLGADEETKVKLEKGKKPAGKPRVAGSARGRELRAAAALARFEVKEEPQFKGEEMVTDSETESEAEDEVYIKPEQDDAVDINGKRLVDRHGHGMVKVCEDEDEDDENAKNELREMQSMKCETPSSSSAKPTPQSKPPPSKPIIPQMSKAAEPQNSELRESNSSRSATSSTAKQQLPPSKDKTTSKPFQPNIKPPMTETPCPICSVLNTPTSLTCSICANVLKPDFVPGSWHCKSEACEDGEYINAGDNIYKTSDQSFHPSKRYDALVAQ
ncbi:hypothetical protein G7Y89_g12370 [Cudoniella acicularis]|uniref:WLM domain-containing protein n=1 Tax=Cudoniella acicularis TaxID=354080 RepID=A0A8H4RBY9_9HELO|nr:hypothetical protein G7Y89_g12370 [Cudoniella acicularis]